MGQLTGKTAIVTGASSGIGSGIATHLAYEGANVVLAARSVHKLEDLAASINANNNGKAVAVQADVSNAPEVTSLIEQAKETFGKVDIYINNAGAMLSARITDGAVDEWEQMVDTNIKGVLYGVNGVLPDMITQKSGHIINIASVSGFEVTKVSTVYSATKSAVRAISIGLEKELARTGVRVTNISPGQVNTRENTNKDRKPLETDDIAHAVIYALTQPDYVNVNEITVRPV
ncbi:Gluconate 5-dehydrogenase [Lentibacillus sp. JNUCC-1]|uniref:SDR family oxidoreductase n=1 Tax=Lentibacillus sp. JNUCC-1 TaxID=2654513 RepID=UPI0012E78645|nr:SDR family oxidoreductase [Lentibacillus sp. JNUCC-1]MUV36323.1 Gluconate 5-dehydrogenase [Lentibacillus sp. JNUCC-1]